MPFRKSLRGSPVAPFTRRYESPSPGGTAIWVPVSAVIKHPCQGDVYEVAMRYGRRIRVTGDHSLFRRRADGQPEPVHVNQLEVGDHVAIAAFLPVVEQDRPEVSLAEHLLTTRNDSDLWDYAVIAPSLAPIVARHREAIHEALRESGRIRARRLRNGLACATRKYERTGTVPLAVIKRLGLEVPADGRLRMNTGGAHVSLPATLSVTDDLLWLLGFFLAEGCSYRSGKSAYLSFSSDQRYLDHAAAILRGQLGVHVVEQPPTVGRAPALYAHSRLLVLLFDEIFGVAGGQFCFPSSKWGGTYGRG